MPRQPLVIVEEDVATKSEVQSAVQVPKKYQVVLYNDDYTPMNFVVEVIMRFFHVTEDVAVRMMMQVHQEGQAVCGVFTHDVAKTLVGLVNEYARLHEYPLLCGMDAL